MVMQLTILMMMRDGKLLQVVEMERVLEIMLVKLILVVTTLEGIDANKKSEPVSSVNGGTVGKLDETVVANEDGKSNNKNKGISNDGAVGKNGNRNTGNGDLKKNTVNNRSGSKNDIGVSKGNETNKGRKGGNEVKAKESLGSKSVFTSNMFDILGVEGVNEVGDLWKEVKDKVATACNTNVPIEENVLKGWNDDMVRFYSVKWNNRSWKNGSVKQQFEAEIKSLSSRIAQISRNIKFNSKLNAEKFLKNSVLTNQDNSDVSFRNSQFGVQIYNFHVDIRAVALEETLLLRAFSNTLHSSNVPNVPSSGNGYCTFGSGVKLRSKTKKEIKKTEYEKLY
ncbi:hypothetical protein CTI12_AA521840 [Artemisia annua]|uniref:Uncharacterized protein n=1 Tax=Artemisia annua TaxID=35608 RepID=A0A2U1L1K2_ARTAN|nr:hypothetical protein CTI12_AA521840 [Artemisia annua]